MGQRDQVFGGVLVLIAALVAVAWFYKLLTGGNVLLMLEIVVSIMLLVILGIIAWIGYTIASTPSLEEIEAKVRRRGK